jgi:phosphoribosylanthranilate isomerase
LVEADTLNPVPRPTIDGIIAGLRQSIAIPTANPNVNQPTTRTRIKICGITRLADATSAVAREIIAELPPFVTTVGLFVDADLATVREIVRDSGVDLVQFHGQETPEYCQHSPRPYIKVIQARPGVDFNASAARYAGARALLVDNHHPQLAGGTGQTFDWSLLPVLRDFPLILAGGLNAQNVAAAIAQTEPYAVDVSGGVESSKGIKDFDKMREFVAEVQQVERNS